MNQKNKIQSLELLNYEGPVLVAHKHKSKDFFILTDQYKNIIEVFSFKKFLKFLNGEIDVVDSAGKRFNYADAHTDAKPSKEFLELFKSALHEQLR